MSDLQQQFKEGVKWSTIGTIGSGLLQLLQTIVFARIAGPEQAGLYALVVTVTAFLLPLAEAGLGQAVIQAKELDGRQVAVLGWLNFGIGLVIFLGYCAGASWFERWYHLPESANLLIFMAFPLLFTPFATQYGGLLIRHIRFDLSAQLEGLATVLSFVVMLLLALRGHGAWAMAWGYMVKIIFSCIGSWWYGRQYLKVEWLRPAPLHTAVGLVRVGILDLSARWADIAVNYVDKLMIGKWLGPVALGYYNQAFVLYLIPITRLGSVVTKVVFPVTARMQTDMPGVQAFFERSSKQLILLLFPIYFGMALFSREIITVLYGETWAPAAPVLTILSLAGLVRTCATLIPQVMRGLGRPQEQMYMSLVWMAALNGSLILFLYCNAGIETAAWSRLFAKIAFELGILYFFAKRCGIHFGTTYRFAFQLALKMGSIALLVWCMGYWVNTTIFAKIALQIALLVLGWGWLLRKTYAEAI